MTYQKTLFIFRRDLRLEDNTGLIAALKKSELVIPCFILDTRQIGNKNQYKSNNAIQFMVESLEQLDEQLHKKKGRLYLFHGIAHEIVEKIITTEKIQAVFVNRDYTPFSITRDEMIKNICMRHGVSFESYGDLLLNEPETVLTGNGTPFAVFTPYWRKSITNAVRQPETLPKHARFAHETIGHGVKKTIYETILPIKNKFIAQSGGRHNALKILKTIDDFKKYKETRDFPFLKTTELSAHHKFGTISIRESYHAMIDALGKSSALVRQLYWRDFFTQLAFHSPFVFGHAFHKKYEHVAWNKSKKDFDRWCSGTTGFPLVDAGIRQLNQTGWMHNRVRMVVASFLTKDLHISWLWGEQYFARMLVDYDPAVNNGSWQWAASTGADAQPYFRIFNPWLQQKKFDSDCAYIKTWIPELKKLDPKVIHNWHKVKPDHTIKYPAPMVTHETEQRISKMLYKKAAESKD